MPISTNMSSSNISCWEDFPMSSELCSHISSESSDSCIRVSMLLNSSILLSCTYVLTSKGTTLMTLAAHQGFFFHFLNCCSIAVVSMFPSPFSPASPTPPSHPQSYPALALSVGPLYMFLNDPPPRAPNCEQKVHWFGSWSGHMPGLQARSPVGSEATD